MDEPKAIQTKLEEAAPKMSQGCESTLPSLSLTAPATGLGANVIARKPMSLPALLKQSPKSPAKKRAIEPTKLFKAATQPAIFFTGVFIAAILGSWANNSFSPVFAPLINQKPIPPYVEHFSQARALLNVAEAETAMNVALLEGKKTEPNSERWSNLAAELGKYFDAHGQFLDAKEAYSRALIPVFSGPECREFRRSLIISTGESEHAAFQAKQIVSIDSGVLTDLNNAGEIFDQSMVPEHQKRSSRAYAALGKLFADQGQFGQSDDAFDKASKYIEDGELSEDCDLLKARWFAAMQCLVFDIEARKLKPPSSIVPTSNAGIAFDANLEQTKLLEMLNNNQFSQLEKFFQKAQKLQTRDMQGKSITAHLCELLADGQDGNSREGWGERETQLKDYFAAMPTSQFAVNSLADFYTMQAESMLKGSENGKVADDKLLDFYSNLYTSTQYLRYGLDMLADAASPDGGSQNIESAWISAVQMNESAGRRHSINPFPEQRINDAIISALGHPQGDN